MKLLKKLPLNRSYDQVLNHYLVEKNIATKLKNANRDERKRIHQTMYNELFQQVPDHPRLTRMNSDIMSCNANKDKLSLIKKHLNKSTVFSEFAPGDCRFSYEVAKQVKQVYGVDISNQNGTNNEIPKNFKFIRYDGYCLDQIASNTIDVVFSDQLIEHIHPEDTKLHFKLVHRILKKGGKYVFRAPHQMTGPHDISAYFSDQAEGFHLKEWNYREIQELIKALQFDNFKPLWHKRGISLGLPYYYFACTEKILELLPYQFRKKIAKYLIPSLYGVAIK